MISLKETLHYKNVVKELNFPFADVYIFDGFVVSEVKEGITFSWNEHAKVMVEEISTFAQTNGEDIIYISHRINSYSVIASDWLKFFKHSYGLKNYGVVGYKKASFLNTMMENLFFNNKIKRFTDLNAAIDWASNKTLEELNA